MMILKGQRCRRLIFGAVMLIVGLSLIAMFEAASMDRRSLAGLETCIYEAIADGRCDRVNNVKECSYDGGDCCRSTCLASCYGIDLALGRRNRTEPCAFECGSTKYDCIDDALFEAPGAAAWCRNGEIASNSECYLNSTMLGRALQACRISTWTFGNTASSHWSCGSNAPECIESKTDLTPPGCDLQASHCTRLPCCTDAIVSQFIDVNMDFDVTGEMLYDHCQSTRADDDTPCTEIISDCIRRNARQAGGCCHCYQGWGGWKCDIALCMPPCIHGECVAPDQCVCEKHWQGNRCQHPRCDPECVVEHGVCVFPGTCQCFPGYAGSRCEVIVSIPPCVRGTAISSRICRCDPGWGGPICDYPLCQSWPEPSTKCGEGWCYEPYVCQCAPGWTKSDTFNNRWAAGNARTAWALQHPLNLTQNDDRFDANYDEVDGMLNLTYVSMNASKCGRPSHCSFHVDSNCAECTPDGVSCLKCYSGFVLVPLRELDGHTDSNRTISTQLLPTLKCQSCSLLFDNCLLCDLTKGCTSCDPMFHIQQGRCVSEVYVEFLAEHSLVT
eukprot:GHVT01102000.1.p1 GENE.GHVT01102000.1~~GHVT01102000.1.p1  ORF type:complete len:556 (-),score=-19.95 GHVT01102000.1:1058-2725(-)